MASTGRCCAQTPTIFQRILFSRPTFQYKAPVDEQQIGDVGVAQYRLRPEATSTNLAQRSLAERTSRTLAWHASLLVCVQRVTPRWPASYVKDSLPSENVLQYGRIAYR